MAHEHSTQWHMSKWHMSILCALSMKGILIRKNFYDLPS